MMQQKKIDPTGEREKETTNPITIIKSIYESQGVAGLSTGITPRILRAIASGAVQFASYELAQNAIHS